jgi:hypothetical protein
MPVVYVICINLVSGWALVAPFRFVLANFLHEGTFYADVEGFPT